MNELDIIELQDSEAVKNTFYRYPKITPHINKYQDYVEIKTIDYSTELRKPEEVILYIIALLSLSFLYNTIVGSDRLALTSLYAFCDSKYRIYFIIKRISYILFLPVYY